MLVEILEAGELMAANDGGLPDPMVELILSAHKERKKSKTKTLNPVWANEMRRIPIVHWALPNLLVFRVISNNDIGLRELGYCKDSCACSGYAAYESKITRKGSAM